MPDVPDIRYAKTADGVTIAYQVFGEGPDLLFHQGWVSNVEAMWDIRECARFFRRLAAFCRVIVFDKRGVGLSDRGVGMPGLEEKADDARAVMDAVGIERAHVFGESEGGPMLIQMAATHPGRVQSLMLYGTFARLVWAPDFPIGVPREAFSMFIDAVEGTWGRPESLDLLFEWTKDEDASAETVAASLRWCRLSASPREAADSLRRNFDLDVRAALPTISVPTLVLHRVGDHVIRVDNGRYLAEHIKGARLSNCPTERTTSTRAERIFFSTPSKSGSRAKHRRTRRMSTASWPPCFSPTS